MAPWPLLLLLSVPALAGADKLLGVDPALSASYVPSGSGSWKCLDGSKEIPWTSVNDDYCDCADGSDEPGTGACPNSVFYCENKGHIGGKIPSSRVNDGLCEPECCDGSDERPGVCPNKCKEIGDAYRTKMEAANKIRKTGSKIRSSYINFAHKEKKRLEEQVIKLAQEIKAKEPEVARLQDLADRMESLSAVALEHKQQSPLYRSLVQHSNALKSLQREQKKLKEREKALEGILSNLRTGYNPNYQDMAVLEAVRGWEFLAGLPHIGVEEDKLAAEAEANAENSEETEAVPAEKEEEVLEDGMWTKEQLESDLDALVNTDYVGLLIEHEEHIKSPLDDESALFDLASYIPDSVLPHYEDFKYTILGWMETLGIVKGASDASADATRARQALSDAEKDLNRLKEDLQNTESDITEIFNIHGFGAEGEWKKLDNTCLELNNGEYTYEICMFNEAKQKPNNGGSTFSLGKFSSWNTAENVTPGSLEYHSQQRYTEGTKCWNGPARSVNLVLSCGTENALLSVAELEKCEYQITGTTPALCLPLDAPAVKHVEL